MKSDFANRCWIVAALAGIVHSSASHAMEPGAPVQSPAPGDADRIPYPSVADALREVQAVPGARVSTTKPDNWTVVNLPGGQGMWSFVPPLHYAYPAAVRRKIQRDPTGDVHIAMKVLCEAKKDDCDRLVAEFQKLNEQIRERIQSKMKKPETDSPGGSNPR